MEPAKPLALSTQPIVVWQDGKERILVKIRDAWEGCESRMDLMIEKQSLSEGDDPEWYSVDDSLWVTPSQAQAVRGAIEAYLLPVNVLTNQNRGDS
jgi:hypothetical protein